MAPVAFLAMLERSEAAFLQPERQTQLIATTSLSGFSRSFDAAGRISRSATFAKASLDVFVEHGLTSSLTLVANASSDGLVPKYASDPGRNTTWQGMAGLRAPLWQKDGGIISVQALAGGWRDVGRNGATVDVRLMMGRNLVVASLPGFADIQLAWRENTPDARRELRFDATFGMRPTDQLMLLAQVFTAYGVPKSGQRRSLRVKPQIGVVWSFASGWAIQANAFHTLYGVNTVQEAGITLGFWRRF